MFHVIALFSQVVGREGVLLKSKMFGQHDTPPTLFLPHHIVNTWGEPGMSALDEVSI